MPTSLWPRAARAFVTSAAAAAGAPLLFDPPAPAEPERALRSLVLAASTLPSTADAVAVVERLLASAAGGAPLAGLHIALPSHAAQYCECRGEISEVKEMQRNRCREMQGDAGRCREMQAVTSLALSFFLPLTVSLTSHQLRCCDLQPAWNHRLQSLHCVARTFQSSLPLQRHDLREGARSRRCEQQQS